jgi:AraC-like DNA-binding protein
MPIYMDIHDTTEATAEDIAAAHQRDLTYQDKFNCKFVYFWHDIPNRTGFCVFEAPNKESVINLHNKTHVTVLPNQIIEVEISEIEFFLGKIADIAWSKRNSPFDGYISETVHRAIMDLEIVNPLTLRAQISKSKFVELLNSQKKIIKNSFLKYEGNVVSWENNSIITSFLSEENAINCAVDIQKKFTNVSEKDNHKLSFSMGLNFGAPVTKSDNLFGDVINLAKKLGYIAGDNKILMSSSLGKVYNKLKSETGTKNDFITVLNSRYEEFLIRLLETIEQKWNEEEFNIDSLVEQFGMSRAQLYRRIMDLTGHSPNNFIRDIRLKNALKLIEAQKGSISEIAYESGFNNPSYFSRCFHKKFGILPSTYAHSLL